MTKYNLTPRQENAVKEMVKAAKRGSNEFVHGGFQGFGEQACFPRPDGTEVCVAILEAELIHLQQLGFVTLRRSHGLLLGCMLQRAFDAVESGFHEAPPSPTLGSIVVSGDMTVGDTYTATQVGSMGPYAQAHDTTFQQIWDKNAGTIDLQSLARELGTLRAVLRRRASEPEHDLSLGAVAGAETAAKQNDGPKVLAYLRAAGKWALDGATEVGTTIAAAAIQKSLGM
jgi:hypothetical protein